MSEAPVDAARPVREGEQLDVARVEAFLRANVPELPGDAGPPVIDQFPGGHSNLTYLVRLGSRELVLRRPPFGNRVKSAHDMGREHTLLRGLSQVYPLAPRPLAYCDDPEVLGAPFYVMERLRGTILRRSSGDLLAPDTARRLGVAFVDNLATLHGLDAPTRAAAGLGDVGKPEGYVVRQVTGWAKRYEDARTDDVPQVEAAREWLMARMEGRGAPARAAVIHNDYKLDNLVLDPTDLTRILGVLDWEMATVGDPLMDLGTALAYWVQADDAEEERFFAYGPTHVPGSLTRQQILERYEERTGRRVDDPLFYFVFALFKNAGVAQQIYWRFKQGLTTDPRFEAMILGVRVLGAAMQRALDRGTI